MERRTFMKAVGGMAAVTGVSAVALSGGAAAATVNASISAEDVSVDNDRGNLSRVTIAPELSLDWDGFDEAVGKVFCLIEAKVGDGEFAPVFRATPWLTADQMGTDSDVTFPLTDGTITPLVIADADGKPDYSSISYPAGVTAESFLNGTSVGSASAYEELGLQNNYPEENAGYYGAASDTTPFDAETDGEDVATDVTLRYTFELQTPNDNQIAAQKGETQSRADYLDSAGIQESDVETGESLIVMKETGGDTFEDPSGIPYSTLQESDHVAAVSTTSTFTVSVANDPSTNAADGSSNTGAE